MTTGVLLSLRDCLKDRRSNPQLQSFVEKNETSKMSNTNGLPELTVHLIFIYLFPPARRAKKGFQRGARSRRPVGEMRRSKPNEARSFWIYGFQKRPLRIEGESCRREPNEQRSFWINGFQKRLCRIEEPGPFGAGLGARSAHRLPIVPPTPPPAPGGRRRPCGRSPGRWGGRRPRCSRRPRGRQRRRRRR